MKGSRYVSLSVLLSTLLSAAAIGIAQEPEEAAEGTHSISLPPGLEAELDEARAFDEVREGHHIKARELAEAVLRNRPDSFVAHLVLAQVHHYGEADLPRALYFGRRARSLFVAAHGDHPEPPAPWRWHARTLRELVWIYGDIGRFQEQLEQMALYSELYNPDFIAERAWPFMKMRRFEDAREAARLGRESGDPRQLETALNALCAIEFEAGNAHDSYDACAEAMGLHGADPAQQSSVDFTNFAEAARSVFRLDEAERVGLLATEARLSWYGNPWVEVGELYIRQGRFAEALEAMREIPRYRARRPPHVRESNRNEGRRALASFFLVAGRGEDAIRVSEQALNAPERRAHTSRDPAQDKIVHALLHRAALQLQGQLILEQSAGAPFYERIWAWLSASWQGFGAWVSGRVAARSLLEGENLVGTFMIGTHRGAIMMPWIAGELSEIVGPGVVLEALEEARQEDGRVEARAYYQAFEADARLLAGDPERARYLATEAAEHLNASEALLRSRMLAIAAESSRLLGEPGQAIEAYGEAFQLDPGIFRRLGWRVPVVLRIEGSDAADEAADLLGSGPRFDSGDWGLTLRVSGDAAELRICLESPGGARLSCEQTRAEAHEDGDALATRAVGAFYRRAFAPRVDLSQADSRSLDGSNQVSEDPLQTLLGQPLGGDPAPRRVPSVEPTAP